LKIRTAIFLFLEIIVSSAAVVETDFLDPMEHSHGKELRNISMNVSSVSFLSPKPENIAPVPPQLLTHGGRPDDPLVGPACKYVHIPLFPHKLSSAAGPALPFAICTKTKLKHDWLISHVGWL
jgi:hypothetical protein